MSVTKHQVEGFQEFLEKIKDLEKEKEKTILVMFSGSKDQKSGGIKRNRGGIINYASV